MKLGFTVALCLLGSVLSYCPDGWIRDDNSCYLFVDLLTKPWDAAGLYCKTFEAHLVWVDSQEEHNFIKAELAKFHPANELQFWTAGNDIAQEGHWVWGNSTDGYEVSFWHPGEPNASNGGEDCMAYYPKHHEDWNDERCIRPMAFICELEDPKDIGEIVG